VWQRLQEIYWQHECLTHPIPPNIVVYSSGPPVMSLVSHEWSRFDAVMSPMGTRSSGTVYLGERIAYNGLRQLVAVDAIVNQTALHANTLQSFVTVVARTMKQGSLIAAPAETSSQMDACIYTVILPQRSSRSVLLPQLLIRSATEDAANPAHFQFYYDLASARVAYDCWLLPEGTVRLDRTYPTQAVTTPSSQPAR
jgi:hypothetical protein